MYKNCTYYMYIPVYILVAMRALDIWGIAIENKFFSPLDEVALLQKLLKTLCLSCCQNYSGVDIIGINFAPRLGQAPSMEQLTIFIFISYQSALEMSTRLHDFLLYIFYCQVSPFLVVILFNRDLKFMNDEEDVASNFVNLVSESIIFPKLTPEGFLQASQAVP